MRCVTTEDLLTGIDVLIMRGPSLDDLISAIEISTGVPRNAIVQPDSLDDAYTVIMAHANWVVIHEFRDGDIGYKVAIDGEVPQNYVAIARRLGKALGAAIAWPDERTLSPTAFIRRMPDGSESSVTVDDLDDLDQSSDGLKVISPCRNPGVDDLTG
jgi:hypothetical protein